MGKLIVHKMKYNSILVTWQTLQCDPFNGILNSPSFILVTDRYSIAFSLSLHCYANAILKVQKNGSKIGRAIVTVGITKEANSATMQMCLNEKWGKSCIFDDIVTLSPQKCSNLKINCKITWLGFIDDIPSPEHSPSLLSVENVQFDNTVFPDFTIIAEGQEIPSHRAILAGHSPVFLSMFKTPMKESEENKVTIEDIEYSTMKTLLKIIYTGNTEDLNEIDTALKVFRAAAKYEMSRTKVLCEDRLQQMIQVDNVLMLLAEADKYNAVLLCETCVAYIFAVQDDKITEEFQKFARKPNISLAVMDAFMDHILSIPCQKNKWSTII